MDHTIAALWNGEFAPAQKCGVQEPELEHLTVLLDRNRTLLEGELNDTQKERFGKYIECADEFAAMSAQRAFCDGFRLAARLVSESLMGDV